MRILLTGGTGLIGSTLVPALIQQGHQILLLTHRTQQPAMPHIQPLEAEELRLRKNLDDIDAVINLAGEPIMAQRWSDQRKAELETSRWNLTQRLATLIRQSDDPPVLFLSGSAMGYYGDQGEAALNEAHPPGVGFTSELCQRWEALACRAESEVTRVCLLRTANVLTARGGVIAAMLPRLRYGMGRRLGSGRQYFSWIHLDDMVAAILWLMRTPQLRGPIVMAAPEPVHNRQFCQQLAHYAHLPALFPAPAWVLRQVLGEAATLLLDSQRAMPEKLLQSGFPFRYPSLTLALQELLANPA